VASWPAVKTPRKSNVVDEICERATGKLQRIGERKS
jgi:hypothetical protein